MITIFFTAGNDYNCTDEEINDYIDKNYSSSNNVYVGNMLDYDAYVNASKTLALLKSNIDKIVIVSSSKYFEDNPEYLLNLTSYLILTAIKTTDKRIDVDYAFYNILKRRENIKNNKLKNKVILLGTYQGEYSEDNVKIGLSNIIDGDFEITTLSDTSIFDGSNIIFLIELYENAYNVNFKPDWAEENNVILITNYQLFTSIYENKIREVIDSAPSNVLIIDTPLINENNILDIPIISRNMYKALSESCIYPTVTSSKYLLQLSVYAKEYCNDKCRKMYEQERILDVPNSDLIVVLLPNKVADFDILADRQIKLARLIGVPVIFITI